jgi:RNA polymerase sigma-70 factor (ECF subfamily)
MLAQETTFELPGTTESRESVHPRETAAVFEALYAENSDAVFRYLRARTSSEDDALDLAATTFERALRFVERNHTVDLGAGWLLRTARNAAIDAARRRRTAELVARVLPWRERDVPSPEVALLADERAAELRRAVSSLPEAQRDAITLRFTTDLTVHEIAQAIGRTEAATHKQISRGLARLREVLDDDR